MENFEFFAGEWNFPSEHFNLACDKNYVKEKMGMSRFDQIRLCVRANDSKDKGDGIDILSMLVKKIKSLNQNLLNQDFPLIKAIYLTSTDEIVRQRIETMKEIISKYNTKFKILSRTDIKQFLTLDFLWCESFQIDYSNLQENDKYGKSRQENLIDLVEHELAVDASVFMQSPGRDWSYMIQMERVTSVIKKDKDFSSLELIFHLNDFSSEFKEIKRPSTDNNDSLNEGDQIIKILEPNASVSQNQFEEFINDNNGLVQLPNENNMDNEELDYKDIDFKFQMKEDLDESKMVISAVREKMVKINESLLGEDE